MEQNQIPSSFFAGNRKRLSDKIEKDAIVILFSNDQKLRTGDQYYPYRQSSDLFYLTGIEQEETILLLQPDHQNSKHKEILFLLVPDKKMEIYLDRKFSFEEGQVLSGVENVLPLTDFESYLQSILKETDKIYTIFSGGENCVGQNQGTTVAQKIFQEYSSISLNPIEPLITELRLKKQSVEIELLKRACNITNEVYKEVIENVKPGIFEYEIDALLQYGFLKRGIKSLSFEPIIASGENALRLHYTRKDKKCNDGELLLFDIGCEYHNYCSDCSRTIPVNGKFTERQKECYNAVLNVYEQVKTLFIKGNTIAGINKEVLTFMADELLNLGLITREQHDNKEEQIFQVKRYLPHGISHFVGLDTHDVGTSDIVLEEGMVLSCEPGIYIPEEKIGIRIETMLLITEEKPYNFFPDTYLTVEEIEQALK